MGQTLSEPVRDKNTTSGYDDRLYYGSSSMQGWRITMEDAHTTLLNLNADKSSAPRISFFGVFDGHGGPTVAKYAGAKLHFRVAKDEYYKKGVFGEALKSGFLGVDEDLRSDQEFANDPSGCTAVACLITDDWRIFVANAGDSRAVLSSKGEAIPLSFDHKPANQAELKRITAAGGFVEFGRVNGNLALSRAIGDFEFKRNNELPPEEQVVTAYPDVVERQLEEGDEFVVLACDG
ncbi:Protein phosphatase 2C 2 [Quaeritorhiza haematococci]|nr:Protein phosphatase 2C 2 [Quaeritorhiza haematococci]